MDKNEDGLISLLEFSRTLESTLELYFNNDKIVESVFDRID